MPNNDKNIWSLLPTELHLIILEQLFQRLDFGCNCPERWHTQYTSYLDRQRAMKTLKCWKTFRLVCKEWNRIIPLVVKELRVNLSPESDKQKLQGSLMPIIESVKDLESDFARRSQFISQFRNLKSLTEYRPEKYRSYEPIEYGGEHEVNRLFVSLAKRLPKSIESISSYSSKFIMSLPSVKYIHYDYYAHTITDDDMDVLLRERKQQLKSIAFRFCECKYLPLPNLQDSCVERLEISFCEDQYGSPWGFPTIPFHPTLKSFKIPEFRFSWDIRDYENTNLEELECSYICSQRDICDGYPEYIGTKLKRLIVRDTCFLIPEVLELLSVYKDTLEELWIGNVQLEKKCKLKALVKEFTRLKVFNIQHVNMRTLKRDKYETYEFVNLFSSDHWVNVLTYVEPSHNNNNTVSQ